MTTSTEEWIALRTELTNTSTPQLSSPARSSCWALVSLSILGTLLHLIPLIYSSLNSRLSHHQGLFRFDLRGHCQPILNICLPILFFIHSLLNLTAIICLITDLDSSRFRGRTYAIQQACYSLLLCAGLIKTWDLVAQLPSPPPSLSQSRSMLRLNVSPRLSNAFGHASLILSFLLPIPCLILTSHAVDDLDSLTPLLIETIDKILKDPSEALLDQATQLIQGLQSAANTLATHTRMLAGLHLLLTTVILIGFLVASFAITRSLKGQLIIFRDSLEYRYEAAAAKAKAAGIKSLPPAHLPTRSPAVGSTVSIDQPLCGGGELASLADRYSSLHHQSHQLKLDAGFVTLVAASYMALNLCIVTNALKYPVETSLGSLLLISIQWASWSWVAIPGPLLAIASCLKLTRKVKSSFISSDQEEHHQSTSSKDQINLSNLQIKNHSQDHLTSHSASTSFNAYDFKS